MLDGFDPRTELIYRFALWGISAHCRGDRMFSLRTDALAMIILGRQHDGSAALAEILREAGAVADRAMGVRGA